jgi:hypothetical protein
MGRKKRKLATDVEEGSNVVGSNEPENSIRIKQEEHVEAADGQIQQPQPRAEGVIKPKDPLIVVTTSTLASSAEEKASKAATSSGYSMTTHSGEIVEDDIYVSDGSEDENEYGTTPTDKDVEILLTGSRMGVMRRGLHHPLLVQSNRQWVRPDHHSATGNQQPSDVATNATETEEEAEERRRRQEEEELAKLDPAQRAARLLAEKQRKLEEAKEKARMLESEENAGRDPCLFSKRTSFDIRFDSIEDKPWTRGVGDMTDYFNYGLTEEDWMEYSQQQLMIRQELSEANRQKRPPDPTIVPVMPRKPRSQNPKVAVVGRVMDDDMMNDGTEPMLVASDEDDEPIGPFMMSTRKEGDTSASGDYGEESANNPESMASQQHQPYDVPVGIGGAWGAGAAPGSVLARLIEEQERKEGVGLQETSTATSEQDAYNDNEFQVKQEDDVSQHYPDEQSSSHQEHGNNNDYPPIYHETPWRGGRGGGGNRPGGFQNRYAEHPPPSYGEGRNFPPPPQQYGQPSFRGRGGYGGNNPFHRGGAPRPPYGMPPPWAAGGGRGGGRSGGDFPRKHPREDFQDDGRWRR